MSIVVPNIKLIHKHYMSNWWDKESDPPYATPTESLLWLIKHKLVTGPAMWGECYQSDLLIIIRQMDEWQRITRNKLEKARRY